MSLRQLLRLLLVLLFHLLHSLRGSILLRQLLMLVILLLLEALPFLILLRDNTILLILVFLVQFRISRVGCGEVLDGRQVFSMGSKIGTRSCRNRRGAMVSGNPLLRVVVRKIGVLSLTCRRRDMVFMSGGFFLKVGPLVDPAVTAIIADMAACVFVHS